MTGEYHQEDGGDILWVPFEKMERFMVDVFTGLGVPPQDAAICADVLIEADRRGIDSHGVGRLKTIYYDRIKAGLQKPVTEFEIVREGPTTAVVDGHLGMGQVIAWRAMNLAIEKASGYGLGMVAVRNSSHYGIAGYYSLMAVEKGMIGITGTNARPSIAPTFGVENMLGTNPWSFGMPTDEEFPFLFDAATSVVQRGKIETFARAGKPLPAGWVVDQNCQPLTDAREVLDMLLTGQASLTPLGGIGEEGAGYKGYGFATVVEILSSALQAGAFLKSLSGFSNGVRVPVPLGHFFIAINIESFIELDSFRKTAGDILRALRASRKAPGADRIYTAGEKEFIISQERKKLGVPLNHVLRKEALEMIEELQLHHHRSLFEVE